MVAIRVPATVGPDFCLYQHEDGSVDLARVGRKSGRGHCINIKLSDLVPVFDAIAAALQSGVTSND